MAIPAQAQTPLLGKWEYVDCNIKNTSVEGVLEFSSDKFTFKGKIHEDFPTQPFEEKYEYKISNNKIIYSMEGKNYPPVRAYWFIEGGFLYFSNRAMKSVLDDWSGAYRKTNWDYKLKYIK
jgi:hypothetical protein